MSQKAIQKADGLTFKCFFCSTNASTSVRWERALPAWLVRTTRETLEHRLAFVTTPNAKAYTTYDSDSIRIQSDSSKICTLGALVDVTEGLNLNYKDFRFMNFEN